MPPADVIAAPVLPTTLLDPGARPPARSRGDDAGYDLAALHAATIEAGGRELIGTGVAVAIPVGWCGLIVPRSGLGARHGVVPVLGLIDPGYRGELRVTLRNQGATAFEVATGDRIAQLLLLPVVLPAIELVEELPPATDDRGRSGFGSSGR